MRILHTADWHLGKKLDHISRLPEQEAVLEEIISIADQEDVHVVIIAGDLFDTFNPSAEATDLFFRTLKQLSNDGKRPVIAIAGNHDSPDRIDAPDPLAKTCGIFLAGSLNHRTVPVELGFGTRVTHAEPGFLELVVPPFTNPVRMILTPYVNEFRLRQFLGEENREVALRNLLAAHWQNLADKYCDSSGINLLVAHLFLAEKGQTSFEEPEEEKPILHVGGAQAFFPEDLPDNLSYAALGHLHRPHEIKGKSFPVVYAGSPLCFSFSEAGQEKSVVIVDTEPGKAAKINRIPLKSGRKVWRKTFDSVEAAKNWLAENPKSIAEITVKVDQFLNAAEKNKLYALNSDLFLMLQLKNSESGVLKENTIDLSKRIEDLFIDYFKSKHEHQAPDPVLLDLFKEILAEEDQ